MKTEIELRKRGIALHLQGRSKSEIARRRQRSRSWVQRWIGRYHPDEPRLSLQNRSRAPKRMSWVYQERIKTMVLRIRPERGKGQPAKHQYALVSAQAIYCELHALHVSPLPSPRTIHGWLKQADQKAQVSKTTQAHLSASALQSGERYAGAGFQGTILLTGSHAQVLPGRIARQPEQKDRAASPG